jgi:Na+/melibiose symporter-like transporter
MDALTKVIKKIAALLENIGYGLIGTAMYTYMTDTAGATNVIGALVVGFVSLIGGTIIDILNDEIK